MQQIECGKDSQGEAKAHEAQCEVATPPFIGGSGMAKTYRSPSYPVSACGHVRTAPNQKVPILQSVWTSLGEFFQRHPRLYGSFLESRVLCLRIRRPWTAGSIRPAEIGPYWEAIGASVLRLNMQTHLRTQDTQKLLSDFPRTSPEDLHLFLLGWTAGWESAQRISHKKGASVGNT
jgi:hypothetical protein